MTFIFLSLQALKENIPLFGNDLLNCWGKTFKMDYILTCSGDIKLQHIIL
jgi:hypothetical protein